MSITSQAERPVELRVLPRTLASFRAHGQMDVAFGGRVNAAATSLDISDTLGTHTRSLSNLTVGNGSGMGSRALALGRPVSVANYLASEGFTHAYDHAVEPESLETVAALPIVVDRVPRLMIYLAARTQVELGDRWFDSFGPLVHRLKQDIAVDDEVRRRLALLEAVRAPEQETSRLAAADLRDIAAELAALAVQVGDASVARRIRAMEERLTAASSPRRTEFAARLTRREVDVLREVAKGLSNSEAAESLGLLPNTVKSYLKTAMRKLHAANRVQAITAARQIGAID